MSKEGFVEIFSALSKLKNLRKLLICFADCPNISDEAIEIFLAELPSFIFLKKLDIDLHDSAFFDKNQVSDKTLFSLAKAIIKLKCRLLQVPSH